MRASVAFEKEVRNKHLLLLLINCLCMMTFELKKILLLLSLMVLMSAPTGQTALVATSNATSTTTSTAAPSATSTAAPTLTFNCSTDTQIEIVPPSSLNYHRITIRKESKETLMTEDPVEPGTCERELSNITTHIILNNCTLGERLHVYIMKERLPTIYGGKDFHEYIIMCNLPANGTIQTVAAELTVSQILSTPTPLTHVPTLALQMTISPNTDVFVGEKLILKITLNNPNSGSSLYILPESCNATSGKPSQSPTLNLLSKGTTNDAEIMTNFNVTMGSANATVYAFRFYDSKTVTLECSVHICGDKSCNAAFQAYASAPPPTTAVSRKRRAAQNTFAKKPPTSTRVVKAMFTIKNEEKSSSGQSAVVNSCIAMFVLLQLQRILQQQQ